MEPLTAMSSPRHTPTMSPPATPPAEHTADTLASDTNLSHEPSASTSHQGPASSDAGVGRRRGKRRLGRNGREGFFGLQGPLGGWSPSLRLENTGSVARDHLASERTFLTYVRTSLAIASTGVALVQLFTIAETETANQALRKFARPLGATFIIIGLLVLALGAVRYFAVQAALLRGMYPAAHASTMLLALALSILIIAVFIILLAVRSTQ